MLYATYFVDLRSWFIEGLSVIDHQEQIIVHLLHSVVLVGLDLLGNHLQVYGIFDDVIILWVQLKLTIAFIKTTGLIHFVKRHELLH